MTNRLAEVRDIFTGKEVDPLSITNEFSRYLAPDVIRGVSDFGLPDEVIGILGGYLNSLHVVMNPVGDDSVSRVDMLKNRDTEQYFWVAVINPDEIARKSDKLRKTGKEQDLPISRKKADRVGIEWTFFELAGDVIGNSVYMQNRFERFVNETNVQKGFGGNLSIVRSFNVESGGNASDGYLRVEQTAFKRGFALELLPDSIVRNGLTDNLSKSRWLVNALRKCYPRIRLTTDIEADPFTTEELASRFGSVVVRPALKEAADYAERFPDEYFDEDEFDVTPSSGILYPVGGNEND